MFCLVLSPFWLMCGIVSRLEPVDRDQWHWDRMKDRHDPVKAEEQTEEKQPLMAP